MTTTTLEEQERRAYADGDVDIAKLLVAVIDDQKDVQDILRHENEVLQNEIDLLKS